MLHKTSDQHLVERLREGDATAMPELQTTYGTRIYQLAFRYMKNREDAEEVTQDVLLRVFGRSTPSAVTRRSRPGSTGLPSTRRCRVCAR